MSKFLDGLTTGEEEEAAGEEHARDGHLKIPIPNPLQVQH